MDKHSKLYSVISYITWIGFLVALVCRDRDDRLVRRHLNQALVLNLIETVGRILGWLHLGLIAEVIDVCVLVLVIMGIVRAFRMSDEPLPVIGETHCLNEALAMKRSHSTSSTGSRKRRRRVKRFLHTIRLLPLLLIYAALATAWLDLPNYEAHVGPGWSLFALIAALPIGIVCGAFALAGRQWGRLLSSALAVAACILMLSAINLTSYCVDCDKVPPRVNALQGWVLRVSGWERAHPNTFMSWDDYRQGEDT